MKISVLGCDPRCLFFAKAVAQNADELNIEKLVFMDDDPEILSVYSEFGSKICRLLHSGVRFSGTDNLVEALISADYVIVLDFPGYERVKIKAERVCGSNSVAAQESFGAASWFAVQYCAPIFEKYCDYAKKYSKPGVKLINLVEPCGILNRIMREKGYGFVCGLSLASAGILRNIAGVLKTDASRLGGRCAGTSGLSVFDRITLDSKDITSKLLESDAVMSNTDCSFFDRSFLQSRGLFPDRSLLYFTDLEKALDCQAEKGKTREELIFENRKKLFAKLKKTDIDNQFDIAVSYVNDYFENIKKEIVFPPKSEDTSVLEFSPFDRELPVYADEIIKFILYFENKDKKQLFILFHDLNDSRPDFAGDVICVGGDPNQENGYAKRDEISDGGIIELLRRLKYSETMFVRSFVDSDARAALDGIALFPGVDSYSLAKKIMTDYYGR